MEESKSGWNVSPELIAANSSTIRNVIALGDYIFYGIKNTILVYDYKQNKVLYSLNGHTGRVNNVSLLDTNEGLTALVSVDADKTMIIWKTNDVASMKWEKKVYKDAHTAEINIVTSTRFKDTLYITSFCLDGEVKVWKSQDMDLQEDIKLAGRLHFGKNLQEAFKMFPVNDRYIMLLTGGFDKNVHVYTIDTQSEEDGNIQYHTSLTGHSNSIRDYCVTESYENDLRYIFSCSQDCLVRVWKICKISDAEAEEELKKQEETEYAVEHLKTKTSYILRFGDSTVYNITLSSVLQHHSSSVSSVKIYEDKERGEADLLNRLTLLTASFDFTVCLWRIDKEAGVWMVQTTLGEMSGNKHAFFGAEFLSPTSIFAFTFNGAFHRWDNEDDVWYNKPCVTGHFDEVPDLDWDTSREYLATTSKDQTTRIFSHCNKIDRWHEVSRPQVHGYDINCVSFLKSVLSRDNKSEHKFPDHLVAGADEKILRVFNSPFTFVKSANKYNQDDLRFVEDMTNEEVENAILGKKPEVASMTLGLMNKPVMPKRNQRVDEAKEGGTTVDDFEPDVLTNQLNVGEELIEDTDNDIMLTEEYLMTKTRWPERSKLYGHAFEIHCVATTKAGDYIVTAARSKQKKYSNIFVWTVESLNPICQIPVHDFTIHQMEFSPDDKYLLCVSRDRQFSVLERSGNLEEPFKIVQVQKQAHKRILWCCSWAHNSKYFATGSREKVNSLKFWEYCEEKNQWAEESKIEKGLNNVTSVAFFPGFLNLGSPSFGVVVGVDSGELSIWTREVESSIKEWTLAYKFPEFLSHSLTVRRIKFKQEATTESGEYEVATCSNDATVRIFKLCPTVAS
ncbi:unnamed protein product [Moneuplotes crassus]|uniref:Elongator complex protein 2 n=1 Tax=Euplotes crassus TaxID=5936 RepID=A0AAD1Y2F9_EUPCR|nr:unnamed protein product [Moneuplotes crassus]